MSVLPSFCPQSELGVDGSVARALVSRVKNKSREV